jgi:hypothetical protein
MQSTPIFAHRLTCNEKILELNRKPSLHILLTEVGWGKRQRLPTVTHFSVPGFFLPSLRSKDIQYIRFLYCRLLYIIIAVTVKGTCMTMRPIFQFFLYQFGTGPLLNC